MCFYNIVNSAVVIFIPDLARWQVNNTFSHGIKGRCLWCLLKLIGVVGNAGIKNNYSVYSRSFV